MDDALGFIQDCVALRNRIHAIVFCSFVLYCYLIDISKYIISIVDPTADYLIDPNVENT